MQNAKKSWLYINWERDICIYYEGWSERQCHLIWPQLGSLSIGRPLHIPVNHCKRTAGSNYVCVSRIVVSNSLRSHGLGLPGSSVHGILQARILEWVAISFSRYRLRVYKQIWVSRQSCTYKICEWWELTLFVWFKPVLASQMALCVLW